MALIIPSNWCLIFFRDPEAKFESTRLKKTLTDAGISTSGDSEPFTVAGADGPHMNVSTTRGKFIETVLRGLVGTQRKHQKLVKGCDAQIKITIENLEEALDEMNTLIEVQTSLQTATKGLMYNGWNQQFSGPDEK